MNNKIFISFLILFICSISQLAAEKVKIIAKVNNKIITNYDIQKEIEYLKILNSNLNQLSNENIFKISQESLINQNIKESEIEKYIDLAKTNELLDTLYTDLYKKLNFNNSLEFEKLLKLKKSYSKNEIIQKLKVELYWNDLIFSKFKNQIKIDEKNLIKKINNRKNSIKNEYLLSEIFFKNEKNTNFEDLVIEIKKSIQEIGFKNTANIYSVSDSAKFGGNLGWINEENLSEVIFEELQKINISEYTDIIKVANNYLILKIENIRTNKIEINKKQKLKQMINFERNKQLMQFSNIYFNKIKINSYINET